SLSHGPTVPARSSVCLRLVLGSVFRPGFHRAPERLDLIPVVFLGLLFLGVAGNLAAVVLAGARPAPLRGATRPAGSAPHPLRHTGGLEVGVPAESKGLVDVRQSGALVDDKRPLACLLRD